MTVRKILEEYMNQLEIVDTHEHLPVSNERRNRENDIFGEYVTFYFNRDLITAGMPLQAYKMLFDKDLTITRRWDIVEPFWEKCRFTGYGQALDRAVQILYGMEAVNRDTVEEIDRCIRKSFEENHYQNVLKEKCHIVTALVDVAESMEADRTFFSPVVRVDPYVHIQTYGQFLELEKAYGKNIRRLAHMMDACEKYLTDAAARGAIAFKSGLAYQRSISYELADFSAAEKEFQCAFTRGYDLEIPDRPVKLGAAYENYMMHFCLSVIEEMNLPIQFHTGLQEGNGNLLGNSNPELLNPLFLKYPKLRFDIFHIGYPYQHVLGGLAKMFPNVYVDMCWAHIVSPKACIHSLSEWLETMPYNKILGFGGDHCFVDGVAGHRALAIQNIAAALAGKIEEGLMNEKMACQIAKAILHDNGAELFRVEKG